MILCRMVCVCVLSFYVVVVVLVFKKSGILSVCLTFWIQYVCKVYQQMTKLPLADEELRCNVRYQ